MRKKLIKFEHDFETDRAAQARHNDKEKLQL